MKGWDSALMNDIRGILETSVRETRRKINEMAIEMAERHNMTVWEVAAMFIPIIEHVDNGVEIKDDRYFINSTWHIRLIPNPVFDSEQVWQR